MVVQVINGTKCLSDPLSWEEIKKIVKANELELFARSYEEASKYKKFKENLGLQKHSLFQRLVCEQLYWLTSEEYEAKLAKIPGRDESKITIEAHSPGKLFEDPRDIKIVLNEFPYYLEPGVEHLLVWTKNHIPSAENGDISNETRALIDKYIDTTFIKRFNIDPENLVWFRNWEALQSVKQISHVHVLIRNLDKECLQQILNSH